MAVASAEDDRLLLRPAGRQEVLEEVASHRGHALGQQQAVLEGGGLVAHPGRHPAHRRSGVGIAQGLVAQIVLVHSALAVGPGLVVQEDVAPEDLARRQVAVLDALAHVVLVDRRPEMGAVVRGDLRVGQRLPGPLGDLESPRGRGQADLHRPGIPGEHLRPLAPGRAVALVDDDVAEVVLRVVRGQEVGVGLLGVHVERLVGRDEHPGVLLRVAAGYRGRVGAEHVLERAESLASQLVPIAHEQRAVELAGVGDAPEQVHRDARLARAGGQGEQGPRLAAGQLLEHGPDRRVLVVATGALLAARVARDEGTGRGGIQAEAHRLLVAGAQLGRRGKLAERPGCARDATGPVELHELVAVGGEDEGDVEPSAGPVGLGLLQPVAGREVLRLGLDERHRHRLATLADLHPEQ